MFNAIVIMLKGVACIVGWVNVNALYFSGIILFEGFKGKQVVAVYEHVSPLLASPQGGGVAVTILGVFNEYAWFELGFFAFANPGEFEFL
jgi:hypothetical protein